MAKLGSSSCRPLLQGMMLLAVLLLASTQAGPVMAASLGQAADLVRGGEEILQGHGVGEIPEKVKDSANNMFTTELDKRRKERFSKGWKAGYKTYKYSCKALGWVEKLSPGLGGASGTPSFVDDTLGADLSRSLSTFSYYVNMMSFCPQQVLVPAAGGTGSSTTLFPSGYNDGRYYVQMKDILVGQDVFVGLTPMKAVILMSTTQGYTYLERTVYDRLTAVVKVQMIMLGATLTSSPFTAEQLCYTGVELWRLPRITILLANNNAAMRPMELDGAAWDNQPSMFCLGILPATTEEPVLGTMIQSGKTMNIDLRGPGGRGTLTF